MKAKLWAVKLVAMMVVASVNKMVDYLDFELAAS